jgi:transcriptional regulator with XRE-family HTH domain
MNETFFSLIGMRLEEERKRLGLKSQKAAGDACGVSREIWGKYERGTVMPGGEVLFSFAEAGADVQYILTGIPSATTLAADERLLLERYRSSSQALKDAALRVLLNGEQDPSGAKFIVHGSVGQNVQTHTMSDFKIDMRKTKKRKE